MSRLYFIHYLVSLCIVVAAVSAGDATAGIRGDRRFEITVGGGWGSTDQSDINDKYIDELAIPAELLDDNLSRPASFFGEIGYRLPPRHVLSFGLFYMSGKSARESSSLIIDENRRTIGTMTTSNELEVSAVIPQLRVKYLIATSEWNPSVNLGVEYAFGAAKWSQETVVDSSSAVLWRTENEYSGRGWGWTVTLGMEHSLSGPLSLGFEGGYRRLLTDDLEDEGGRVWRFDGSSPAQAIRLDFSGWFFVGTLTADL